MLGWLLDGPRVTAMAQVVHEMACFAHHSRDTLGTPLHRHFTRYPTLKNHRAPSPADRDQVHTFWISDGRQGFNVMVCDGEQGKGAWLSVSPDGDFDGAHVQSTRKGRYIVRLDQPLARPQGRLAVKLVDAFATKYDAANASI